ncbi:hypothetical protein KEM56_002748, partial [Ascosphaera pollenicola]
MSARKPSSATNDCGFVENNTGTVSNVRMGTSTTITSASPSPGREAGCGIKRSLSRRCRKGLSCIMGLNSVKETAKGSSDGSGISQPANVVHVTHVGFDERTGEYT